MTGVFKQTIQMPLNVFPDAVAPGFDDHAAADRRVLGQVRGADDLLVPLRVILGAGGRNRGFGFLGHEPGVYPAQKVNAAPNLYAFLTAKGTNPAFI